MTFSKLHFSKFKKFVTRSVFGEFQARKISLSFKTSQNYVGFLLLERNYEVLKSKSPCILLNKNTNLNKNKTESKIEDPTHSFRNTNFVVQLM